LPYALGIDIGSSYLKAAVRRTHHSGTGRDERPVLGIGGDTVPSVLHVGADGSVVVGEAAEDGGPAERHWVARGFAERIGDKVPFILGGNAYPAPELLATVISWVIDEATDTAREAPEHIAVTQPAGWSQYQLNVLRSAMGRFGLGGVMLVPELTAAALDYVAECRVDIGDLVAVCDLGGSAYRAGVLRRSGTTRFEPLARPERTEPAAGADPGEAVFAHVRAELGSGLGRIDLAEPGAWQAAVALRRACVNALQTLASDSQAVIPVSLPTIRTTVGMTRQQLEDKVRPAAKEGAELIRRALRAAGVQPGQLSAVLLVGGPAQVPFVRQVISTELRRPVAVAADPQAAMARGAAVAALHVVRPDSVPAPGPGRALGVDPGAAVVPRPRGDVTGDETMVLFPEHSPAEVRPLPVPDLDELAGEVPPRPPLELSPLPFDIDDQLVSEQPMWKRIALGGGAVGGIVLVLTLVAWFVFGSPLHSTSSVQPIVSSSSTVESPAPDPSRTTENP
jgi:molecular chaperone DnaK (HSP70)